jgi:hypothetical protein
MQICHRIIEVRCLMTSVRDYPHNSCQNITYVFALARGCTRRCIGTDLTVLTGRLPCSRGKRTYPVHVYLSDLDSSFGRHCVGTYQTSIAALAGIAWVRERCKGSRRAHTPVKSSHYRRTTCMTLVAERFGERADVAGKLSRVAMQAIPWIRAWSIL